MQTQKHIKTKIKPLFADEPFNTLNVGLLRDNQLSFGRELQFLSRSRNP
jgi:hypothetical protein